MKIPEICNLPGLFTSADASPHPRSRERRVLPQSDDYHDSIDKEDKDTSKKRMPSTTLCAYIRDLLCDIFLLLFSQKPQDFPDSPLLLEIEALGGCRRPQKTADHRRKPQQTAGNCRLGSVTLGPSPLARPKKGWGSLKGF